MYRSPTAFIEDTEIVDWWREDFFHLEWWIYWVNFFSIRVIMISFAYQFDDMSSTQYDKTNATVYIIPFHEIKLKDYAFRSRDYFYNFVEWLGISSLRRTFDNMLVFVADKT